MGCKLVSMALCACLVLAVAPQSTAAASRIQGDQFDRVVKVVGDLNVDNPFGGTIKQWLLRSVIDKKMKSVSHQLYITLWYIGDWRFYEIASDDRASPSTSCRSPATSAPVAAAAA
jgi:hypothetical protein